MPSSGAHRPRMSSITSMPCGPPKPRKAVCEVLWVCATRPSNAHVRDPVGVVDVAQRPGEHRLAQVEAPAAVGGQRRRQADESAVVVEPDLPRGMEAVPLAGHGEVVGAVEPDPDRPSGERCPECGNRCEAVRLHLLAAEAAAHAQALRGDVVALHAEHVRHDLLGLGGVLGAALHEHLPALVDQGQRGVGLEVEVLLPGHLGDALEDVGRGGQRGVDLPALDHRAGSLEALGLDRLGQRDHRRKRLVVDDDGLGTEPGGLEGLPQHPAHGLPDEHHDLGEERLVVLDAGIVDPRHVLGGEHAHHPGDVERRGGVEPGDPRVRVRRADRVGVQDVVRPVDQVVGVERLSGDVERRALVGQRTADAAHCSAHQERSALPSIAER